MGAVAEAIRGKLEAVFSPSRLELADDSDRHHGHAGHSGAGESHFTLRIEAEAFAGKARVMRQRMVMKVLADELAGPVHALSIVATAPGEA
ncbi:BolA family transcriptional regulator [Caulobacter segnis]|uniref:BolA family transcriptional regulator n=1 Tax=Caulobacter segnis TaxID=88688 RepID=A0A2W5WI10_9CAUL|nr:BolA family protein [Caulobacter segnis]PZR33388.1 MAG: BolA family transcriptional regulator [Caulobacter segnis]